MLISLNQFLHKDKQPEETISQIKSILFSLNIDLDEIYYQFSDNCYSVRVFDRKYPRIGANGKGITKEFARASAYAELMERLQNRTLVKGRYGLLEPAHETFADARTIPIEKSGFPEDACIPLDEQCGRVISACYPYFNVGNGTIEYLPHDLLMFACGTNGMSAGNSREEAIIQAICEVMERYVVRQVIVNQISLPTIPLSFFRSGPCWPIIRSFMDQGFGMVVKDATLGSLFPVLAVIIISNKGNQYKICFASDPVFEVALSRCLTEVVQGVRAGALTDTMVTMPWGAAGSEADAGAQRSLLQFLCNGRSALPYQVLLNSPESYSLPEDMGCFIERSRDNHSMLGHLLKIISDLKVNLYIRDVSFLGFPSYHIYIPGMSPMRSLSIEQVRERLLEAEAFRNLFLRMKSVTREEAAFLALSMEHRLEVPWNGLKQLYFKFADIVLDTACDWLSMSARDQVALLYLRAGNYRKALENMMADEVATNGDGLSPRSCLLAFLSMKARGMDQPSMEASLAELYGEKIASSILQYVHNFDAALEPFELPACGDCALCPLDRWCFHDRWKELEQLLWRRISESAIDQGRIAEISRSSTQESNNRD